jgi:hypothetical protein
VGVLEPTTTTRDDFGEGGARELPALPGGRSLDASVCAVDGVDGRTGGAMGTGERDDGDRIPDTRSDVTDPAGDVGEPETVELERSGKVTGAGGGLRGRGSSARTNSSRFTRGLAKTTRFHAENVANNRTRAVTVSSVIRFRVTASLQARIIASREAVTLASSISFLLFDRDWDSTLEMLPSTASMSRIVLVMSACSLACVATD